MVSPYLKTRAGSSICLWPQNVLQATTKYLTINKSNIQGLGLFALSKIEKGKNWHYTFLMNHLKQLL